MLRFGLFLLTLLILIKFECGYGDIGTKNSTTVSPTLCNQCSETDSCQAGADFDANSYHCNDTHCIRQSRVCDGVPDCPQAQDETVSLCGCLNNEYQCTNKCIELVKRCDTIADCDDEEDETDCKTHVCPISHFKCANYFCIPNHKVCDFKNDCGDGSDELHCNYRECWSNEFTCKNLECVRPAYICDGEPKCLDGSDEENCSEDDFIECGDKHVHSTFWCDGMPDCEDNHADELLCNVTCSLNQYRCPNGLCVNNANVCDGQCDCLPDADGKCADEMRENCSTFYTKTDGVVLCHSGLTLSCWTPDGKHSRCIRQEFVCDGQNDCLNKLWFSDEFGCNAPDAHSNDTSFRCRDGRWLSPESKCNSKEECLFGDDETGCGTPSPCDESQFQCKSGECVESRYRCDGLINCWDKSDEIGCESLPCPGKDWQRCAVGQQCVSPEKWCDYVVDCIDGSDEKNCSYRPCRIDEFRCDSGQCVPPEHRCRITGDGRTGCVDKSHVKNCRDYECAGNEFKCHRGPCIDQSLVCNNQVDCEATWDDEDNCPFACSQSAPNCQCQDVHINCTGLGLRKFPQDVEKAFTFFHFGGNNFSDDLHAKTFEHLERLVLLDLSNNSIRRLGPSVFATLWRLKTLNLQKNELTVLQNDSFLGLGQLTGLHLQGNNIGKLNSMAFHGLSSLITLDLSRQNISVIEPEAFVGLRSLKSLDLSNNVLAHLRDGTFRGIPQVAFLNLKNNNLRVIGHNVFFAMPYLEKLFTDEFRFCCLARHAEQCSPPPDEFSSCEDLMSNIVLRVCVWMLAAVAIVANLLVIVFRARYKHTNQVHSFLIVNLALGDLLMGSYLLVIAVVDWHYRGVYFIHDLDWRRSHMCNVAGFISTFSSELSVFTLTVITLERLLVIIFPFKVRRLQMDFTRLLMAVCWFLAIIISAVPLFNIHYFRNFYGRSGVCLALHITPDKPNGWEYSVFIFLFVNLGSLLLISGSYLWMFFVAKTTHRATETLIRHRSLSESAMAWRMSLLVATDAACWVPIIGLGLWSLAGFTVHPQVFAWVAVFVLPLNAAVNPVLYTLSAVPMIRRNVATNRTVSFRRSLTNDAKRTVSTTAMPMTSTVQYNGDTVMFSMITKIPSSGTEITETEMTDNSKSNTFGKMI